MKTFRLISAILLAVLMCANFASCSKDDNGATTDGGGNDEGSNQEVIVSEKKLVKMIGKNENNDETYTFSYDSEGRLKTATYNQVYEGTAHNYDYQIIWGDDAIKAKIKYADGEEHSYTYTLANGLVQRCDDNETFSYNSSNRLIGVDYEDDKYDYRTEVIWDKDKLVSVKNYYNGNTYYDTTFTYGTTCKKGYYPLIPETVYWDMLFVAHPETLGIQTTQLPTTYTKKYSYSSNVESADITYEFDKEGYISKIKYEYEDGNVATYTLTWK